MSVTGSRRYPFTQEVWKTLDAADQLEALAKAQRLVRVNVDRFPNDWGVVSGGAIGPDTWGIEAAERRGLSTRVHLPEWDKYGRGAGHRRNKLIVLDADSCLVFWDGESKGTAGFIKLAFRARKELYIIGPTGTPWAIYDQEYWDQYDFTPKRMDIPGLT